MDCEAECGQIIPAALLVLLVIELFVCDLLRNSGCHSFYSALSTHASVVAKVITIQLSVIFCIVLASSACFRSTPADKRIQSLPQNAC